MEMGVVLETILMKVPEQQLVVVRSGEERGGEEGGEASFADPQRRKPRG